MTKIRLVEAEQTSLDLGGVRLSVLAEQPEVTNAVKAAFADSVISEEADCGVVVGQPAKERRGDQALHVAYESGQPILLRARRVDEVGAAVIAHLTQVLRASQEITALPMRLRAVCHPERGALLAFPAAIRDWTGFDRRLQRHGWQVLPTTISFVDPASGSLLIDDAIRGLGPADLPASLPILSVFALANQQHVETDARRIGILARVAVLGLRSDHGAILRNLVQWHDRGVTIRVGSLAELRASARGLCGLGQSAEG